MKIQIFTLCDFAQSNSGKLTIVGTFNRIFSGSFPFNYVPPFFVVARVCSNEAYSGTFTLSVEDPDGKPFFDSITGDFRIPNPENDDKEKAADFCLALNNQRFQKPGKYVFKFVVGNLVATQDLYLCET